MDVSTSIRRDKVPTPQSHWPPKQGQWTYEDWLQLPDDGCRYEVIDGVLYMTPLPSTQHQRISACIVGRLMEFLKSEPLGEVIYAPVGVRLPNQLTPLQLVFGMTAGLESVSETMARLRGDHCAL